MADHLLYCLALDDEPLALKILENYISVSTGLKLVAKCETVEDAFKALSAEYIDTIFLDLNLKEVYGLELIDRMKNETYGRYYIIITSALPQIDDFQKKFDSDKIVFVDFLPKPFSYESFLKVVKKTIEQKQKSHGEDQL